MKSKPLGCLTRLGMIAALLTLLTVSAVSLVKGNVLFSPGALSRKAGDLPLGGVDSHAEIGGQCERCHSAPWDRSNMSSKCLACHVDLDQDPQNFHGVMLAQSQQTDCFSCHPEHRGLDAPLTVFNLDRFPHNAMGFSLRAHQENYDGSKFACSGCHPADYTHFDQLTCLACHLQAEAIFIQSHLAIFGKDCLACHDGIETYGKSFDHQKTGFPLEGNHIPLSCTDCHPRAIAISNLKGTPQDCYACHTKNDPHQGGFGHDCVQCHTSDGWDQASFDHSQAAFQLSGAHQNVECQKCHVNNIFKGTPTNCAACHTEPAFHAGLLGTDCETCHSTTGWSPATFSRSHNFPLNHGEGSPSCKTCHSNSLGTYTCYGCHEHNPDNIATKHREEGIINFQDCIRCHPTGQGEGGGGD